MQRTCWLVHAWNMMLNMLMQHQQPGPYNSPNSSTPSRPAHFKAHDMLLGIMMQHCGHNLPTQTCRESLLTLKQLTGYMMITIIHRYASQEHNINKACERQVSAHTLKHLTWYCTWSCSVRSVQLKSSRVAAVTWRGSTTMLTKPPLACPTCSCTEAGTGTGAYRGDAAEGEAGGGVG